MDELKTEMPKLYQAIQKLIREANDKPVVYINAYDGGSLYVCSRISKLRIDPRFPELTGHCRWLNIPRGQRPESVPLIMRISWSDCLMIGKGWWHDGYFDTYYVYNPDLTALSLAGDHSWVTRFLANRNRQIARRKKKLADSK